MGSERFPQAYKNLHAQRHLISLEFLNQYVSKTEKILDLGPRNPLAELLEKEGFQLTNTAPGIDLDLDYSVVQSPDYPVLTAFEILEHLVSPFPLLQQASANKLIASVPLKLWFSKAYWNEKDEFDRHYHEFEPRQFDLLLQKSGWKIIDKKYLKTASFKLGIRPLLRFIYPRIYLVYCERI